MNIIKTGIVIFLILFGQLLLNRINKSKEYRFRQSILPWVAAGYGIIVSIAALVFVDKLRLLLAYVEELNLYTAGIDILLANLIVMYSFVIVKGIVICFISNEDKSGNDKNSYQEYYVYNADHDKYFIRKRWEEFKRVFGISMRLYAIFCMGFLALTWIEGPDSIFYVHIAPVVLLMVMLEFYNFLNGYTKSEYEMEVGGEGSYAQKINNAFRLRQIFEALFSHNLLEAKTGCEYTTQKGTIDYIKELELSRDLADNMTAEFFASNEGKEKYDADYIRAMSKLMKGQNVVFFNPFYRDLGKYLILPMIRALISDEKCLVILGRNSTKEDIKQWIEGLIRSYCKVDAVWKVDELKSYETDCDVGILCFNELYDIANMEKNRAFFDNTGFVFILEPSLVINTGQIGFSILADQMKESGLSPVYCIADRMVEGLVDTMSHLLKEKITEVIAPPVPRFIHTEMAWDADGDYLRQNLFEKQTRFLGNGFELAAVAVKNQIPHVEWISESKAPIADLKWIVGQYYTSLCKYMNLPIQQNSIYEKISFNSNLWSVERKQEQFLIVDDEFCNIFGMLRMYLSRAESQVFVNVMSENYLLRDYMRCNVQMFSTNPTLIPSIVPDYAKTERNTVLKILFVMAYKPMSESEIRNELSLIHYSCEDVLNSLTLLVRKYILIPEENIFTVQTKKVIDGATGTELEFYYSIPVGIFHKYLDQILSNAYYIVEIENDKKEYIDAKLFSQVTQTNLPGQFVVYEGKYYQVNHISVEHGVILRRAADLYDRRTYYRQVRKYILDRMDASQIISRKKIMDVVMEILCVDFHVETTGYLEMNSNHDLRSARLVDYTGDESVNQLTRRYQNKNMLRILLPETSNHERFTICMLLMEMFHTIFPNTWQYLACVTKRPDEIEGMLNYMMYEFEAEEEDQYIYIFEDSTLDLGLLEAIDKNFMRFMEILSDYINWHFEKMREVERQDPVIKTINMPDEEFLKKRKKGLAALLDRIAKLFGGKKEEEEAPVIREEPEEVDKDTPEKTEEAKPEEAEEDGYSFEEEEKTKEPEVPAPVMEEEEVIIDSEDLDDSDIIDIDGTDIFDDDIDREHEEYFEEHFKALGLTERVQTRYQKECYLKFGFDEIDRRIELDLVRKYLNARGWAKDSSISLARTREMLQENMLYLDAVNQCDFCGKPLSGVSYERINDGRIRCNDCSSSAINSVEEFRELFQHTVGMMTNFYNIEFKENITIKTVDARKIAKGAGMVFKPSTEYAARVLGYAQKTRDNKYSLNIENGSPRLATTSTMVHEMTHIWQYLNWKDRDIFALYGKGQLRDVIYEGMAMWAEIQYLYLIGETAYAMQQEAQAKQRKDVYGIGFNLFIEQYPLIKDSSMVSMSPFNTFPPINFN